MKRLRPPRFERFVKKTRPYHYLCLKTKQYGKGIIKMYILLFLIGIVGIILVARLWPKEVEEVSEYIEEQAVETKEIIEEKTVILSKAEREDIVYSILREHGYTMAGTCGIMGNIAVESIEFEPDILRYDGSAYGLFQWTDVGDRRSRMKKWCTENGYDFKEIEPQVLYAIYELEGGDSIACRMNSYLKKTDDAYTAAVEFAAGFERCITDDSANAKYTGGIYPEFYGKRYQSLKKRITKAMNYYLHYSKEEDTDSR